MSARQTWRRLALGLPTVLGTARRGWFIPYRYAATLPEAGASPPYDAVERLFAREAAAFAATLDAVDAHADALRAIAAGPAPAGWRAKPARFDQGWFPTLDAAVAYAMVRDRRPRRIVEIGSGHSTRFLARAAVDGGLDVEITAIDPAPRADIALLPGVRVVRETVHAAGAAPFAALAGGDVLSIDSSHVLMPGSDVDLLFNRVLPALPAGALVHIHDIFLPDDYPAAWAWRNYNEQQGVSPLLTGGGYAPLFASHHAATRMAARVAASVVAGLPAAAGSHPASLWLRKDHPPLS
ncbi:MAG: class I SAM-dependent methyltransferase [Rhodospirillales bacterium]|nr:MAG: class I SAM-dependent methyltransferase [Rhodospirillales bacterium]